METRNDRRWWILAVLCLSVLLVVVDNTIVNVALPTISKDLHASTSALQWIVDGYTLMFAALLLSAGPLCDRIGARRAFAGGLIAFITASMTCGFAPTLTVLVASRFVQGVGAAVMMPSSMALIGHAFPEPRERAGAVAAWAMGGTPRPDGMKLNSRTSVWRAVCDSDGRCHPWFG